MTTSDWIGGSGDWSDAADWSNGVPNDGSAVANLDGSNAYAVTIAGPLDGGSTESFTVGTLNIANLNAALNIDGTLTIASEIDMAFSCRENFKTALKMCSRASRQLQALSLSVVKDGRNEHLNSLSILSPEPLPRVDHESKLTL